jgi:hypothetical protein
VPDTVRTRTLQEETHRVFRARVVNPKWIAAMQRHGYKGAFELAATVDYLFGYDATAGVVDDWMYEKLASAYVFDETNRAFMAEEQPLGAARHQRAAARGGRPRSVGGAVRRDARRPEADLPRAGGRPRGGVAREQGTDGCVRAVEGRCQRLLDRSEGPLGEEDGVPVRQRGDGHEQVPRLVLAGRHSGGLGSRTASTSALAAATSGWRPLSRPAPKTTSNSGRSSTAKAT